MSIKFFCTLLNIIITFLIEVFYCFSCAKFHKTTLCTPLNIIHVKGD